MDTLCRKGKARFPERAGGERDAFYEPYIPQMILKHGNSVLW